MILGYAVYHVQIICVLLLHGYALSKGSEIIFSVHSASKASIIKTLRSFCNIARSGIADSYNSLDEEVAVSLLLL